MKILYSLVLLLLLSVTMWVNSFANTIAQTHDDLYPIIENNKVGYINGLGGVVITPQFDVAGYRNGFVSTYGNFHNGLAVVAIDGKKGYIDRTGKWVIEPQFFDALPFSEGLAEVRIFDGVTRPGNWGYIDLTGAFAIEPRFTTIEPFVNGIGIVHDVSQSGYIEKNGKPFIPQYGILPPYIEYRPFKGGVVWLADGTKSILVDREAKIFPLPTIEDHHDFSEGIAAVRIGDKWGYIDTGGKIVIPAKFHDWSGGNDIGEFSEGLARITVFDKAGYIDRKGHFVIAAKYDSAGDFREGLAAVTLHLKTGFINKQGKVVIPLRFFAASPFQNGISNVQIGGKIGFIDKMGRYVIRPKFRFFSNFDGRLAMQTIRRAATRTECQDADWGYINLHGDFVWKIKPGGPCIVRFY
ncbi:MAG: WG repeat-containing protein [Acidobacteriota bacterium]